METLIYNGRQSICFRSGNIFRKYFKYAGLDTAEREAQQSLLFEKLGILTPHFIATGYSESNGFFYNEYFYLEMTALTEEILTDYLLDEIASTVGKISASGFSDQSGVNYWQNEYKNNFNTALDILKKFTGIDFSSNLESIFSRRASSPMHGDFAISNMGVLDSDKELVIFDFHMSGCGMSCWDLAYFIGDSSIDIGYKMYVKYASDELLDCIRLVTAIKLGRSLRRQDNVSRRYEIFQFWRNFNDDYAVRRDK